ncbi:hypothetical protein SKAU_G00418130 [Synaphobranchus kaupii]|uniref:VWFD domain-containing protein n=1 Tax=Synaphobranchus kaupii TaxID=118154 RepID=A0A9Q1E656_SYNKA|nr:hypothetical protein SKAU_G00418130 [Synaphobranchus kaupii]
MFNSNVKEKGKNQLYITSYLSDTNVLVTVSKSPFKKELLMQGGKSETVEVPSDTEMIGTGKYTKTVMIRSSKFITIVSSNQKKNSVETTLVYPVRKLGQEYYVFTPSGTGHPKELAVFGSQDSTSVTVELKCAVTFEGKVYKPHQKLTTHVFASEVLYLESNQDCTGSRVVSDKPVGVISGHACAGKNSECQHTFEQLLPVEQWGTSFIVPALEYQVLEDSVFVFASQSTRFTYQFGPKSQIAVLKAGQWKEIPMGRNPPLVISSNQPVQVLYYCTGGKFSDGSVFDPFIMNIEPTEKFCESYTLEGMEDFNNYALIIAKSKDIKNVQFDDQRPSFNWQQVHETEYSWAHYTYEKGRGHHTLKSPGAPVGVYSVGTMDQNSYGAPAACGLLTCTHNGQHHPPGKAFWEDSACTKLCHCDTSTGLVSCQKSQCKAEEECNVIESESECVAKTITASVNPPKVLPCTHKGQSHPPGKPFWEDSACTELCECNPSTGLVSCQKSQCKAGEECKVIGSVNQCVAKTIPAPVHPAKVLPCTHKGQSHPPGKPFWEDSACTELCECNPSTGLVSCQKSQCKAGEECKVIGGVNQCVAKPIPAPVHPAKALPCTHKGQSHPPGKPFWEDSVCTELCECNPSTGLVSCQKSQCKAGEELLPCTHKGQSHPPGKPFWEDSACTELCECNPSTGLVSCQKSQCKAGEQCKVIDGVTECVAKTIPAPVNPPTVSVCPVNDPDCDCLHQGKLMKFGEAWLSADCFERCACLAGGSVHCEKAGCAPGENCVEKGGVRLCSPPEATCHLLPSGGFKSFDGLEDRVWTEGTYSLAVPAPSTQVALRIIAHLDLFACEPAVIFSSLSYEDLKVEVKKDLTTVVNGKAVSLPFRTNNGLEIVGSENAVVVQHTSGLNLHYCSSGKVSLTLTAAFRGKMAGLCGNFNGRAGDDLRLRDGSVADNFGKFYKDWRI